MYENSASKEVVVAVNVEVIDCVRLLASIDSDRLDKVEARLAVLEDANDKKGP